jgi:glyoxylase I family protein
MTIKGIHHVALICSDYQRSKDFYIAVLGFSVVHEQYRADRDSYKLDLTLPYGTRLELFSFPDPPERLSYPEALGLRHLAFEVDDIDAAVRELQSKGITVEPIQVDLVTRRRYAFFHDPDNLPLELYEAG